MNPAKIDNIMRVAREAQCNGVFREPRMYFDIVSFSGTSQREYGHPSIFRNGEKYPVQLTHLMMAMREQTNVNQQNPVRGDERLVSRYGLRIRQHDSFYMNADYVPLALWHNQNSAAADALAQGQFCWAFGPGQFTLSARDTMLVEVVLEPGLTQTSRLITVSFTGVGLQSQRPYLFSQTYEVSGTAVVSLPTAPYTNKSSEAIVITEMTAFCANEPTNNNPAGDVRAFRLRCRQIGNGTNQWWVSGPINPSNNYAPGTVWGLTTGRAVIHELPQPMLWMPNEGFDIELSYLYFNPDEPRADDIVIAAAGFIEVT